MGAEWKWPPDLRSQDELKAMAAYVTENGYSSNKHDGYDKGVLAALNWMTGEADLSPITRVSLGRPVTGVDVSKEHGSAYEALYANGDPDLWKVTQEMGTQYTLAVEHTTSWATGSDMGLAVPADWPWPQ